MQIKLTAEDAGFSLREAAWNLEERLLWRGSDAARSRASRFANRMGNLAIRAFVRTRLAVRTLFNGPVRRLTHRVTVPAQRLIETKLVWPIVDRWHEHGLIARSGAVALVTAAAVAAGIAGSNLSSTGESGGASTAASASTSAAPLELASSEPTTLQGVAPEFPAEAAAAAPVPEAVPVPAGPGPASVAWRFSQAFVDYEIGRPGSKTAEAFAATAVPELAKALSEDPPRLPHGTPVPEARVLNVVLAEEAPKAGQPKEVVASVSLLRVGSVSEVRLTLRLDPKDKAWKVSEVLG